MTTQIVILAAGSGKRMRSNMPKVLYSLGGKSLLAHVVETVTPLAALPPVIVYGFQGDQLQQQFSSQVLQWVEQKQQLGSAHALLQALPMLHAEQVLVLYGDVPLITAETLKRLMDRTPKNALGITTVQLANPTNYGRVKRDARGHIVRIIEEKDATEEERRINEINAGIYLIPLKQLKAWLPAIQNQNAQGEYYLTDIVTLAVSEGMPIHAVSASFPEEVMGVNDRIQLNTLERFYQNRKAQTLMREGVTLLDPTRFDVRGDATIAPDVTIDVNVILEGRVVIGRGCRIGPHVILRDTVLDEGVEIRAYSFCDGATIARGSVIGPFARLRPGVQLAENVHVGNFVEIKNSDIKAESKINHLSYIGDSDIGQRVNIGAGTITCNYDGADKYRTTIGDDVHIGSDTQLVAPVVIEAGATIGAGSTVTKDVPSHQLTLTHELKQRAIASWKRPKKEVKSVPPVQDEIL